jgi:hypothetical protein
MKRVLLVLLIGLPAVAYADTRVYGVKPVQERVINLPQDQGVYYLTVFGQAGEPRYEQVRSWFQSHAGLANAAAQTKFNTIGADSVMFAERYARTVRQTPCVRLQTASGEVVFEISGADIPMSAEALHSAMAASCLRWGRKNYHYHYQCPVEPQPQPAPQPPQPVPQPAPQPVPKPVNDLPPWWLLLIPAALGAGVGLVEKYHAVHRASK